jgi:D-arginine dehydrogenase
MSESVDILVTGGGISGVSLAGRLAPHARVAVVEAEDHLGTQSTARSAALFGEGHGPEAVRRLCGMSRTFFTDPADGFSDAPLCRPRKIGVYSGPDALDRLRAEFETAARTAFVEWLEAEAFAAACPLLAPGVAAAGFIEPNGFDLEPHALLQAFARVVRRNAGLVLTSAPVRSIERTDGAWRVRAGPHEITCGIIVDAAGAWADPVAELAGAKRVGLTPMRRTAATMPVPAELAGLLPGHPAVIPADESFYFKPDAGAIMVSLSEETPFEACDAYPDDEDVALALERFHAATIVPRARPTATWAGLRTFSPDRLPVVGFDPEVDGFFWYAGQGGSGIEMSPALSALGARLVLGQPLREAEAGLAHAFDPRRFTARG